MGQMSREIKFRVWDTRDYKWIDNAFVRTGDGDVQLYQYDSWEKAWTVCGQEPGRLILEQFSGLKDSNGNPIYEGDILRHGERQGVVTFGEFSDNEFVCHFGWFVNWLYYPEWDDGFNPKSVLDMEIIGNIHEHPHLLSS